MHLTIVIHIVCSLGYAKKGVHMKKHSRIDTAKRMMENTSKHTQQLNAKHGIHRSV